MYATAQKRTDDEVRGELQSDRHDDLLEREDVVGVAHAFLWPWDVDGAASGTEYESRTSCFCDVLAKACTFAAGSHATEGPVGIEITSFVAVKGDI